MPLRDDLLAPIAGDNPSGQNLRYDPVTDKIKEARREELEVPQGEWKTTVKVAEWPVVIKLAGEALATRGKDLQIAVWLADAHIRREGFAIVPACFTFLRDLLEQFWDTLYPELEDGDAEMRAAPLDWFVSKVEEPLRLLPITSDGLGLVKYNESRKTGYEDEAASDDRKKLRQQAVEDGKLTPEEFDAAMEATPKSFYENLQQQIAESLEAMEALNATCDARFADVAPNFGKARTALEEINQAARIFVNKKRGADRRGRPSGSGLRGGRYRSRHRSARRQSSRCRGSGSGGGFGPRGCGRSAGHERRAG